MAAAVRALARVNLAAIERNCARLAAAAAPARLCAVVKADGYGHGAAQAARAARAGGADWLAVATAAEAAELRAAGLAGPLLVMGALTPTELDTALAARADVVAWREAFVAAIARRARETRGSATGGAATDRAGTGSATGGAATGRAGTGSASAAAVDPRPGVHVKLDTGMGRLGTRDSAEAARVVAAVAAAPELRLAGAMTHFATADEDDASFLRAQLAAFAPFARDVRAAHPDALLHAANSAAALVEPAARFDMVRCGIAIYGLGPFQRDPAAHGLEPALELRSYVAEVKRAAPGESAGYGRRFVAERETWIGTIPIGYGDGYRRGLSGNADVMVAGRRVPLVGTVSMDNVTVDLGPADHEPVARGAEAVLIGPGVTAEDLAHRLGTINYEITCALTARVPREYHRDGEHA